MPASTHIISGKNGHKKRKFGRRTSFCPFSLPLGKSKELESNLSESLNLKEKTSNWIELSKWPDIVRYDVVGYTFGGVVMLVNISNGHHLHIDQLYGIHKSASISISISFASASISKFCTGNIWPRSVPLRCWLKNFGPRPIFIWGRIWLQQCC